MSKRNKLFRPAADQSSAMAQVFDNHYGNSLEHISNLANELKKDFGVHESQIKINKFGGDRLKGITFAEVSLGSLEKTPEGYEEVKEIEYIL